MTSLPGRTPRLAAFTAMFLAGCATTGAGWNPFAGSAPPVLTPTASKDEVVAHLNRNIQPCTAWMCHDVKVHVSGVPLPLSATIAVESPRNFRMVVSAIAGDEADFGSNGERMWFWMRRMPKDRQFVYTCSHEDLPAAQQRLPLPFQPDWLMEVLGVVPFDGTAFEMHDDPSNAGVKMLVSETALPDGRTAVRIVTVDTKRGVITAQALRDADGKLIAEAKLKEFRLDPASGVTLPHFVEIAWPEAQSHMRLEIGKIEVNPRTVPATVWQPRRVADCPTYDLGRGQFSTIQ